MEDIYVKSMGGDRPAALGLSQNEEALADYITGLRDDAVLVMIGGSTITMGKYAERAGAVLMAYYPGMEGGNAVAKVLFGKEAPTGKLPFSIPGNENDLPEIDYQAAYQYYGYQTGYRYLESKNKKPLFPFGYGLTYTDFTFSVEEVLWQKNSEEITAKTAINNCGGRNGSEVLQMYIAYEDETKKLCAFRKVFLKKGESKIVLLCCKLHTLEYFDEEADCFRLRNGVYRVYVGNSSAVTEYSEIVLN